MFPSCALITATILASFAFATPIAGPSGPVICGTNVYSAAQLSSALTRGYSRLTSPIDSFPHIFNNGEGLPVTPSCSSSRLFEYPLMTGRTYSGGDPGPDRVVFSATGWYCTVMTHSGAGGNKLTSCMSA
ncbi:guanyl-specific ribonuclease C2 [Mycena metata]|uniref:Guanyl-specific ribonuclease C2 n=1 Tax=Mycena metata TaxID=1033252 RepID=A0AAD7N7G7_9AGAR|nr:guanyl-specific ribonuclease C2 [Mycena metata]